MCRHAKIVGQPDNSVIDSKQLNRAPDDKLNDLLKQEPTM